MIHYVDHPKVFIDQENETMKWIITKDIVNKDEPTNEVGRTGLMKAKTSQETPFRFRLLDGDDVVYFEGLSSDDNSEAAFEPLDTLGNEYGCTTIQYRRKGVWETL